MIRLLALLLLLSPPALAEALRVTVDLSDQRMTVHSEETLLYRWPVSTARAGKRTPTGRFRPQHMVRMHYSSLYNNAPMPWSIFFHGNYAIHGTTQVDRLGTPASAGCVRLASENAKTLFSMVKEVGMSATWIVIRP